VLPTPTGQRTDATSADLQADLLKAKEMTAGPVPLIQVGADPFVELPRGLNVNGTWQRQAMVRELTGIDEEEMSRVKDVTEMYDTVLALGTVRLGEIDLESLPFPERQGHLQQLLLGERDHLYIAIIRATYGDRKALTYTCQNESCGEKQELTLILSEDFKPKVVEDIFETEFTYVSGKGHRIKYRPAVGADQIEALRKRSASMAEQNSIILSRCIKTIDDQLLIDPLRAARELPMKDRHELLTLLVQRQPSVDMSVTIKCVACREEQTISLGWGDIFRP
jgi:hypothetical protein